MVRAVSRAFTIIELIIVVVVIAILAALAVVAYNGMQEHSAGVLVQHTAGDAQRTLQVYYVNNRSYPANIANTDYAPPLTVAVVLYTDAPQAPVYSGLTSEQNAQLFLNTCNGFMPIVSGGTTYSTACVYNGNNLHVKGQVAANVVINGPSIAQSSIVLTCGAVCTTAQNNIISTFTSQGGTFPLTVPKAGSTLPAPTMVNTGNASTYCLEARSPNYSSIIYHTTPDEAVAQAGPCPSGSGLHYP